MIPKKVEKAMNQQINAETYSAYLYLSMRAWLDANDMPGFANWMYVQALEEFTHAEKFYNHIIERGGEVKLTAIEAPETKWDSALAIAKAILEHEQKVTSLINNLMSVAQEEKDYASNTMLQWFVDEQIEEEANATEIVRKVKMIKDNPSALFMFDNEMATRVFTPPAASGE